MRQLVGALVQFAIRQRNPAVLDRARSGRPQHLRFHQFVHADLARIFRLRAIPFRELALLGCGQHGQARNLLLRITRDRLQHRLKMSRHARDRLAIKQIGAVNEAALQPRRPVVQLQIKVELRRADFEVELIQVPPRFIGRRRRHQRKHHRKQRIPAGVAAHRKFLHQAFEGRVVVRECAQRHLAGMRQQLAKRRIARQPHPQRQRILKTSEQRFQFRMLAPRGHRAQHKIFLRAVAPQQRGKAGKNRGEKAGVLAVGQRVQAIGKTFRKSEAMHRPAKTLQGRPRTIRRQFQHRNFPIQLARPVRPRFFELRVVQ